MDSSILLNNKNFTTDYVNNLTKSIFMHNIEGLIFINFHFITIKHLFNF